MILDDILDKYQWGPFGITTPDAVTARKVFKFLREAILDNHIYVTKAIGFKFDSNYTARSHTGTYIARHVQIGDSYAEVLVNLLDKVFLTSSVNDMHAEVEAGNNTLPELTFYGNKRDMSIPVLFTNPDVCYVLDKSCTLRIKTLYSCGYGSIKESSAALPSDYFPCYTDFSIQDFYKVLPMNHGEVLVPIRCYNGATFEQLRNILDTYNKTIKLGNIREDEKKWVSNFML